MMKGWTRKRLVKSWRRFCAAGSIRTIKRGKVRILICCPRGKWKPRKNRCRVGTRAISIDKPRGFRGFKTTIGGPKRRDLKLWRYHKITGLWEYQRTVTDESAWEWLKIFQSQEPDSIFEVSRNKPTKAPRRR